MPTQCAVCTTRLNIPCFKPFITLFLNVREHLPIKNLVRLIYVVSLLVGLSVFFFISITGEAPNTSWIYSLMGSLVNLVLGYSNLYFFGFLGRRSRNRLNGSWIIGVFLSFLIGIVFYFCAYPLLAMINTKLYHLEKGAVPPIVFGIAIDSLLVATLQLILVLQYDKNSAQLELSLLRASHAESVNMLLRQQIQPHFLFNALNTLNALNKRDHKSGEKYLVHLANFLRASISADTGQISRLDQELDLLKNYLAMQQIRFGTALVCSIDIPPDWMQTKFLPSFSLQPLVENAIKHNELTEDSPLLIKVSTQADRIIVSNNLQPRVHKEPSTGNGLSNLTERYRLWCGDSLQINEGTKEFSVSIKTLEHEHSNNRG